MRRDGDQRRSYLLQHSMHAIYVTTAGLFSGLAEPVDIKDNGDGTHTVAYTPSVEGPYSVGVKYAEEDVPRRYVSNTLIVLSNTSHLLILQTSVSARSSSESSPLMMPVKCVPAAPASPPASRPAFLWSSPSTLKTPERVRCPYTSP